MEKYTDKVRATENKHIEINEKSLNIKYCI